MSSLHSDFMTTNLNNYIDKLDAADGSVDGKLTSDNWNKLAEAVGGYYIPDGDKISVKRAKREVGEIFENDNDDLRKKQRDFFDYAAKASDAGYKIGGEMLKISLDKNALKPGNHKKDGYYVYTPSDAKEKLEEFGLEKYFNNSANSRLKMVVFQPDSKVSQGAQSSVAITNAVKEWYNKGANSEEIIYLSMFDKSNWHSADDIDLGLGVGACYIMGLHDNGDGTVSGYIEDVYDYDPNYNGTQIKQVSDAVDIACKLQKSGKLQNYRTLIPIRINIGTTGQRTQQSKTLKKETLGDKAGKLFTRSQKNAIPSTIKKTGKSVLDFIEDAGNFISNLF